MFVVVGHKVEDVASYRPTVTEAMGRPKRWGRSLFKFQLEALTSFSSRRGTGQAFLSETMRVLPKHRCSVEESQRWTHAAEFLPSTCPQLHLGLALLLIIQLSPTSLCSGGRANHTCCEVSVSDVQC